MEKEEERGREVRRGTGGRERILSWLSCVLMFATVEQATNINQSTMNAPVLSAIPTGVVYIQYCVVAILWSCVMQLYILLELCTYKYFITG